MEPVRAIHELTKTGCAGVAIELPAPQRSTLTEARLSPAPSERMPIDGRDDL